VGAGVGGAAPRAPSLSSDEQQEITLLLLLLLPFEAATLLPDPLKEGQAEDEEAPQPRSCTADGGRGGATLIISLASSSLLLLDTQVQSCRHSFCNLYGIGVPSPLQLPRECTRRTPAP
jgi:hypothetical protein